jgi:predicted transcriptional regulator of viral defense system
MKWVELLALLRDEPLFHSSLLNAGTESAASLRRSLVRWVESGRLTQLRRGVYLVAQPFRKEDPHPFVVANQLKAASYVSLQSALAHYGCIPEHVPLVTSVTTGRPETLATAFGSYQYRHLQTRLFFGYRPVILSDNITAFLATPEKALLDLVYLSPRGDSLPFLEELRLQNAESLDLRRLRGLAERMGSARLARAVQNLTGLL